MRLKKSQNIVQELQNMDEHIKDEYKNKCKNLLWVMKYWVNHKGISLLMFIIETYHCKSKAIIQSKQYQSKIM